MGGSGKELAGFKKCLKYKCKLDATGTEFSAPIFALVLARQIVDELLFINSY